MILAGPWPPSYQCRGVFILTYFFQPLNSQFLQIILASSNHHFLGFPTDVSGVQSHPHSTKVKDACCCTSISPHAIFVWCACPHTHTNLPPPFLLLVLVSHWSEEFVVIGLTYVCTKLTFLMFKSIHMKFCNAPLHTTNSVALCEFDLYPC
jgi:hypothetical protein